MASGWIALYGPLIANAAGADVPLDLLLGHVQIESGGRPNSPPTKLDERGLFQIHPATSRDMGFDHSRMFDAAYAIATGVEMFRRMADSVQREYGWLFWHGRDDFFWRFVRFQFAIGSGAVRTIVAAMRTAGVVPASWPAFKSFLTANRAALFSATKHDPLKWAGNVDRVFAAGSQIVRTGVVAASGAGIVLLLVGAGVAVWLWQRNRGAP